MPLGTPRPTFVYEVVHFVKPIIQVETLPRLIRNSPQASGAGHLSLMRNDILLQFYLGKDQRKGQVLIIPKEVSPDISYRE
jgi:hypothetical protein